MAQLLLVSHRWPILRRRHEQPCTDGLGGEPPQTNGRSRLVVLQVLSLGPGRTMHTTHHIRYAEALLVDGTT